MAIFDSSHIHFIDSLYGKLRRDYRVCTGDSSEISIQKLLNWHKSIDNAIEEINYPEIAKKFFKETGLSPLDVRPCEIINWYKTREEMLEKYYELLDESTEKLKKKRDDSLFLARELKKHPNAPYNLMNLPFGIARRSFILLITTRTTVLPFHSDTYIRYDSVPFGTHHYTVAFHFDKQDTYCSYEMESASCHFDSLNIWARPVMNDMADHFEQITGTSPHHIYRVGQYDIVPGRLAICKMWIFPNAYAYIGLSRRNNRFYAKAIITSQK